MFHKYEYYRVGKLDVEYYVRDLENGFFVVVVVPILLLWGMLE